MVGGAGFDVVLSAVSLGAWAAVRSTSIQDILASSIPGYDRREAYERAKLEEGASTGSSGSAQKGHKRQSSAASNRDATSSTRKRGRGRKSTKQDADDVGSEASYQPAPSVAASVAEGDELLRTGELDWESAALVWGITALGGLGAGAAGVLGGECIAR